MGSSLTNLNCHGKEKTYIAHQKGDWQYWSKTVVIVCNVNPATFLVADDLILAKQSGCPLTSCLSLQVKNVLCDDSETKYRATCLHLHITLIQANILIWRTFSPHG